MFKNHKSYFCQKKTNYSYLYSCKHYWCLLKAQCWIVNGTQYRACCPAVVFYSPMATVYVPSVSHPLDLAWVSPVKSHKCRLKCTCLDRVISRGHEGNVDVSALLSSKNVNRYFTCCQTGLTPLTHLRAVAAAPDLTRSNIRCSSERWSPVTEHVHSHQIWRLYLGPQISH